jgi:hypothetical protein
VTQEAAIPSFGQGPNEGEAVGIVAKQVSAIVAAVEGEINQAVAYRTRWPSFDSEETCQTATRH